MTTPGTHCRRGLELLFPGAAASDSTDYRPETYDSNWSIWAVWAEMIQLTMSPMEMSPTTLQSSTTGK